jgi:non-homologous end joining protein Ku
MNARATWKGSLHVSLLALRVKAYTSTTTQQEKIHLHQLHRDCQSRIRYQKVCPLHGPLESDQIVMSYQHTPHDHMEIDLSELDQLRSQHELRAIRIATFVDTGRITPLYYGERHYYLLPDGPAAWQIAQSHPGRLHEKAAGYSQHNDQNQHPLEIFMKRLTNNTAAPSSMKACTRCASF